MRHVVAVALLTQDELSILGNTLTYVWPVDDAPQYEELLAAIDEAERRLEGVAPDQAG